MKRPAAAELLNLWENGQALSWPARAVLLVASADSELRPEDAIDLPIGDRDARIFRFRQLLFGTRMDCVTNCPRCGGMLQTSLSPEEIAGRYNEMAVSRLPIDRIEVDRHEVVFRLPNSGDLLALEEHESHDAERRLLAACILEASEVGQPVAATALPEPILHAVSQRMADTDPCADIRLALECPVCSHHWETVFDIVSHVWSEIDAWARRITAEVHVLASAYGWHERDILAMTDARRRLYLDLIEA